MMMRPLLVLVATLPLMAHADIFRCEVDGRTVFSDSKCSTDAQRLDIQVQTPDEANGEELRRQSERIRQGLDNTARTSRQTEQAPNPRIVWLTEQAQELRRKRDEELKPLQNRLSFPGNDRLERRKLESSIKRITERYDAQLQVIEQEIAELRAGK